MKTKALHQNGKSVENGHAGVSTTVATQSWPKSLLPSVGHNDDGAHRLDDLRAVSRRSLWSLQLFLLISIAAFLVRDFNLYATLPESVLQILGCPPPATLAHIALAGYIFTVVTPLTIHMLNEDKPTAQWRHLGYRTAFYCFYLFSNTLAANFILVFATGLVLYLLEQVSAGVAIDRANLGDGQFA